MTKLDIIAGAEENTYDDAALRYLRSESKNEELLRRKFSISKGSIIDIDESKNDSQADLIKRLYDTPYDVADINALSDRVATYKADAIDNIEYNKIYATIKSGTDMNIGMQRINKDKTRDLLVQIKELVGDQISYHTIAEKQYSKIVSSLSKRGKIIFTLGFILVIARAFFQFATIIFPLGAGFIGVVAIKKFASSFANMLALMIPACTL